MSFGGSTLGGEALGGGTASEAASLVAAWPEELPLPFLDYSGAPTVPTVCSQSPEARIYRRSRFEKTYVSVAARWMLDSAQFAALKAFFADTAFNGAAAFSIALRYPLNSDLSDWVVRFASSLKTNHGDGRWTVDAQLILYMRL